MDSVFLLQHSHSISEENQDLKTIGVYKSKEDALKAIERLKSMPGFSAFSKLIDPLVDDEEDGFYIDEYKLNKDHWAEGYITE